MKTKVKICGITRPEDALVAADCGAWAIGMIFVPGTPRYLTAEQAGRIVSVLPKHVLKVGVFVDAGRDEVKRVDEAVGLDILQLHGTETDLYMKTLGIERCLKTVFLSGPEKLDFALKSEAPTLLIDRPRGSAGGVDWKLAADLAAQRERVLLAGRLHAGNVDDAVRAVRPWGVDVSSGIERAPGVKDKTKIRDFFNAVLRGEAA